MLMRRVRRIVPYIIAVLLIAFLLWQIDPRQIVGQLAGADPMWLLAGAACYIITNFLRAFRFGVLLDMDGMLAPLRLLPEMLALSLLNNTLPARSGELSFPYFMHRRHDVSFGDSGAALVIARIFDYLAVAALYVTFALLEKDRLTSDAGLAVMAVAAALGLSLLPLLAAPWIAAHLLHALNWVLARVGLAGGGLGDFVQEHGERGVVALHRMRTVRAYALVFGWSLLIWLTTFAWFAAFMRAIGFSLDYALIVVGATFGALGKAIPFLTVGGFGAHEAGWTLGFTLVGLDIPTAIASGFSVNILTLCVSILLGGAALLWMSLAGASRPVAAPPDSETGSET